MRELTADGCTELRDLPGRAEPVEPKLSRNTATLKHQEEDIDINCGVIVDGEATVDEVGRRIFELMLDCASGTPSKSELHCIRVG